MQISREKGNSRPGELSPGPQSIFEDNPEQGGWAVEGRVPNWLPPPMALQIWERGLIYCMSGSSPTTRGQRAPFPILNSHYNGSGHQWKKVGRHQIQNSVTGHLVPLDPQHARKTQLKAPPSWGGGCSQFLISCEVLGRMTPTLQDWVIMETQGEMLGEEENLWIF